MKYKHFTKTFSVYLTQDLYEQISQLAGKQKTSKGKIIRKMISNYLKERDLKNG